MKAPLQTKTSSTAPTAFTPVSRGPLQRKCACGGTPGPSGECESCRKKKLQRRSENLDQSFILHPPSSVSEVPPIVHEVLRSAGQPLDAQTRAFMEPRFGHDFSKVRVHKDEKAAESAYSVNALAFTVGQDIVFGEGQFQTQTEVGQKLLAHELTHTIQQGATSPLHPLEMTALGGATEREAEVMANSMMCGHQFTSTRRESLGLARQATSLPAAPTYLTTPTPTPAPAKSEPPTKETKPTITHETKFPAPDGSAKTRTDVGVGEEVTFKGSAAGKWTATSGTPTILENGAIFAWTAPDRAKDVTIKLEVGNENAIVAMKVVEPDSITAIRDNQIAYPAGKAGAGMKLTFNYYPKKVSFGNVENKEVSGEATNIDGYFKKHYTSAQLFHHSGDKFFAIKENNEDSVQDEASIDFPTKPDEAGHFEWVIPNQFKVKTEGGDGKKFTEVTQAFSVDAGGKAKITKAGAEVERSP